MRIIQLAAHHERVRKITVTVANDLAFQILNTKRRLIDRIEAETDKQVVVKGDADFTSDQVDYCCEDGRGRPVDVVPSR